jgi:hypothetical protein
MATGQQLDEVVQQEVIQRLQAGEDGKQIA